MAGEHASHLAALGLDDVRLRGLSSYLDLLASWDRRVNLTGARTAAARVDLLVARVLPLAGLPEPGTLIDVGSGNGSPGLVLALLRPDLDVTLLEPRARRWAFLREAARSAGRPLSALRIRHDGYRGPAARTVTLRGVALPLPSLRHLVEVGGRVLVFGREPDPAPGFVPEPSRLALPSGAHVFRRNVPRET